MKKTLIIGASENPERYAYKAAHALTTHGHEIINLGIKEGIVAGKKIYTDRPEFADIDTITMYVGAKNQADWYEYIFKTSPKRIIFNPNTENPELAELAKKQGIQTENACTLVLLSIGNY